MNSLTAFFIWIIWLWGIHEYHAYVIREMMAGRYNPNTPQAFSFITAMLWPLWMLVLIIAEAFGSKKLWPR